MVKALSIQFALGIIERHRSGDSGLVSPGEFSLHLLINVRAFVGRSFGIEAPFHLRGKKEVNCPVCEESNLKTSIGKQWRFRDRGSDSNDLQAYNKRQEP